MKLRSSKLPSDSFSNNPEILYHTITIFRTKNYPCLYVICQTLKKVFEYISKHRRESGEYDVQRSIFDEVEVFGNVVIT